MSTRMSISKDNNHFLVVFFLNIALPAVAVVYCDVSTACCIAIYPFSSYASLFLKRIMTIARIIKMISEMNATAEPVPTELRANVSL